MTRYLPIISPELDPRNEFQLASEAKERVVIASNGQLNDISPGSPVSALMEGFAFAQAELLNYLNIAPEAWTSTFLSQVLGIQIIASRSSSAVIEFIREDGAVGESFLIPARFRLQASNGVIFETQSAVSFAPNEQIKYVIANSVTEGSTSNVAANTINTPLQPLTGFSSITNPSAAYGGIDGESYNEAKSRAFSQIRRRNPVSGLDFEDLVEDILGEGIRIRVNSNSSSPMVQVRTGTFVDSNSDANAVFEALLNTKRITGQPVEVTETDIDIVAKSLSLQNRDQEHIFISVRSINNSSIDTALLERTRLLVQNRAPIGYIVHIENALVHNVDVQIIVQDNDVSLAPRIESRIRDYFENLDFGENVDYSEVSAIASQLVNISDLFFRTGLIISNQGLPEESIVDNYVVTASRAGNTILARPQGQETGFFFSSTDIIPAYGPNILWNLGSVTVLPSSEFLNTAVYGTLLECRNDGSSVRADGAGGTYVTNDDPACVNLFPDNI